MKIYCYTPNDVGLEQFPSGIMQVAGEHVSPSEAEVFILPAIIHHFTKEQIYRLPYLKGNESRHVFWNCGDDMNTWFDLPGLFIRCDATKEIQSHDHNTIGWPWPVQDMYRPHEPFQYDVVFQGWQTPSSLTNIVVESVRQSKLRTHLQVHDYFFGYHDSDPAYQHLKDSYQDTLSKSRLSLVPRSIPQGVIRYRFYESCSMGRVPVLFADGAVLPLADRIDYSKCSIQISEKDAERTGEILIGWLSEHSDEEIVAMGDYGRQMWLEWLDSRKWNQLFTQVIDGFLHSL